MKLLTLLFVLGLCAIQNDALAGFFNPDSIYLYSVNYNNDSSSIFLKIKGHYANSCAFQCFSRRQVGDSIIAYVGYAIGPTTTPCPISDDYNLGEFAWGEIKVSVVIGADPMNAECDSFYLNQKMVFSLVYDNQYTGIYDWPQLNDKLFPNPVKNRLMLRTDFALRNCSFEIHSIDGKIIQATTQYKSDIDVSFLPSGIYLLVLQDEKQRVVKRFVKE